MAGIKKCPECNSSKLRYDETRGEIICETCGLLVEENMVDTSHELRGFDKSEKNLVAEHQFRYKNLIRDLLQMLVKSRIFIN